MEIAAPESRQPDRSEDQPAMDQVVIGLAVMMCAGQVKGRGMGCLRNDVKIGNFMINDETSNRIN